MFSRKVLFAGMVILFYFSVILLIMTPLHAGVRNSRGRNGFYGSGFMNHITFREMYNRVQWCKGLDYVSPPSNNVVALVSHPGSGNTWLRYLLQQVTGMITGSIYMDYGLHSHGFPGEKLSDGSVLVVKTHDAPPIEPLTFTSAVLLIRNPKDALLADFHRRHKGHIGSASLLDFKRRSQTMRNMTVWENYVLQQTRHWKWFHGRWLNNYSGPVHIVLYSHLVSDTSEVLKDIVTFLNRSITEADLECAMSHKEGIYRRRRKLRNFDPFTPTMYRNLEKAKKYVVSLVKRYVNDHTKENQRLNKLNQYYL